MTRLVMCWDAVDLALGLFVRRKLLVNMLLSTCASLYGLAVIIAHTLHLDDSSLYLCLIRCRAAGPWLSS